MSIPKSNVETASTKREVLQRIDSNEMYVANHHSTLDWILKNGSKSYTTYIRILEFNTANEEDYSS